MATKKETVVSKKPVEDVLTPHRLTVAILIREFSKIREECDIDRRCIRDFCILTLKLIQSPDLTLEELRSLLSSGEYILDTLRIRFDSTISNIYNVGVRFLLDIVDSILRLMAVENTVAKDGIINKNSVVGYFLRRLVIHFDKLTFSEIIIFYDSYKAYSSCLEKNKPAGSSEMGSTLSSHFKILNTDVWRANREWSRRQAELFIATQSGLIINNEERALKPNELHNHIKTLLKSNPDLSEAHFLNYLNYMRVKEFCGAIDSLYHSFDRSADVDSRCTPDDKTKSYRFAALNLAILHYKFGHKEESLAALQEAIKIAQEANDNVCLQHALSWLYCLTLSNRHKLMEHSILKSLDLNLSYIMSLGIQSIVQYAGITMGNPKQALDTITKSDIINCQHSHRDLISSSYAQKSAIWLFYGKSEMSSLWHQLLLYLNTDNPTVSKTYYGEGYCQALCGVAAQLHQEGEYNLCNAVLVLVKKRFPNEPLSHIWMLCENIMNFQHLLFTERLLKAEEVAAKIAVIDKWESCLRVAELLIHKRDYNEAHNCINQILEKCKNGSKKFRMDIQVRAMILLSDIQIATSFPDSVMPGVLGLLNSSLAYANDYHLQYLAAIAQLHVAHVQLLMGMATQALSILDRCLVQILAHGGCYDRARAMLLYVKCIVAAAENKSEVERNKVILDGVTMLENVRKNFAKVEAFYRVKDVLFLKAHLYNELNLTKERNQCALEYRLLDEDFPTTNSYTLLTSL